MRSIIWTILAAGVLAVSACGSPEQTPAKSAPPAVTTPAPAPATIPVPTAPPTTVAEPPPAPLPATAPAPPPPTPVPDKPAAAVTEPSKPPAVAPAPAPQQPAAPTAKVPDSVILAASQGQVNLPHLVHAKAFPCATCHGDGTPGKIGLGKDAAHNLCRDCHKAKGAGPTTCAGCHKK